MWDVSTLSLFPTVSDMAALRAHFGLQEISLADSIGPDPSPALLPPAAELLPQGRRRSVVLADGTIKTEYIPESVSWHKNPKFEASLAARKEAGNTNFLAANMLAVEPTNPPTPKDKWWLTAENVYPYSGQKLQYTELQKERIRQKAASDKDHHYTYSLTYLSGSLCPVNQEEIAQAQAALSKSLCITETVSYTHLTLPTKRIV
eukprot:TRINITY_DN16550_c0_g1_i1.p1 TRINITY_DN16550_c0_g1~~TRINITY_DN16550_c0_g1_i1.p1  ORF type:complete len:204 (+),score=48.18 TRINITY_DN16550_c0_g1_i1:274-885(+)